MKDYPIEKREKSMNNNKVRNNNKDKENLLEMVKELKNALMKVDDKQMEKMSRSILTADLIFVVGSGRSGLVARSLASRLADLGFKVFVVGETIVPCARTTDMIIAISGSGETSFAINAAESARKVGAKVVAMTSVPDSHLAKCSDLILLIPGRVFTPQDKYDYLSRQIIGSYEPLDPRGILFEVAALLVSEAIAIKIGRAI